MSSVENRNTLALPQDFGTAPSISRPGSGSLHDFVQKKKFFKWTHFWIYAGRSTCLVCGPNPRATFVAQHVPPEIGTCAIASRRGGIPEARRQVSVDEICRR